MRSEPNDYLSTGIDLVDFSLFFIKKDKCTIFRNSFKLTKIWLEVSAGLIFVITTFNEEKVKDFL